MGKKVSIKEQIRRNKQSGGGHPTKTVPVWLGADMDLVEQYEAAIQQLDDPPKAKTLDGAGSRAVIEARIAELRAQLEEYRIEWRVRGLDFKRWERLTAQHPPRKAADSTVDPRDRVGWNAETLAPALVRMATVSPQLDDEDWTALLGDDDTEGQLTAGQIDRIAVTIHSLTHTPIDVPFWSAASPTIQDSASE
jgi:hypothetical protein